MPRFHDMSARKILGFKATTELGKIHKLINEYAYEGLELSYVDYDKFFILLITLNKMPFCSIGYEVNGKPYTKLGGVLYEDTDINKCYEKLSDYIKSQPH